MDKAEQRKWMKEYIDYKNNYESVILEIDKRIEMSIPRSTRCAACGFPYLNVKESEVYRFMLRDTARPYTTRDIGEAVFLDVHNVNVAMHGLLNKKVVTRTGTRKQGIFHVDIGYLNQCLLEG